MVGLMRDGHLLAEAHPDQLLRQYNKTSLEDVFLDLCRRQPTADSTTSTLNTPLTPVSSTVNFVDPNTDSETAPLLPRSNQSDGTCVVRLPPTLQFSPSYLGSINVLIRVDSMILCMRVLPTCTACRCMCIRLTGVWCDCRSVDL